LLTGIGGIGKTSIANAYYWKHRKGIGRYNYVRWLKYEGTLRDTFVKSGLHQFYPVSSENPNIIYKAIQIGESNLLSPKLLIIDNCDNLKDRLLRDFASFDILITSRQKSDNLYPIEVPPLSKSELTQLFLTLSNLKTFTEAESDAFNNLLVTLGDHTLMVILLAKLLRKQKNKKINIISLSKAYKNYADELLNQDNVEVVEYSDEEKIANLIEKTFDLSELQNKKYYNLIYIILSNLCILPDAEISEFSKWLKINNHKDLNNAISDLEELGWVSLYSKGDNKHISIHPFIKEVLQVKLKPTVTICKEMISSLAYLVDVKFSEETPYSKIRLTIFCEGIINRFYGEEEVIILQSDLGTVYLNQYEFEKSEQSCKAALKSANKNWGNGNARNAQIHNNLGLAYWQLGKLDKAENEFKTALDIDLREYDEEHEEVIIDLHNLALIYLEKEKLNLELAEKYFKKALVLDTNLYGENSPTVAIDLNNLSKVCELRGDFDESINLVERALSINYQHLQKKGIKIDLVIAKRLQRLAQLYSRSKRSIEYAHICANEALDIAFELVGEDNLFTGIVYARKGRIFIEEQKYNEALNMLEKALSIYRIKYGLEHKETIIIEELQKQVKEIIK